MTRGGRWRAEKGTAMYGTAIDERRRDDQIENMMCGVDAICDSAIGQLVIGAHALLYADTKRARGERPYDWARAWKREERRDALIEWTERRWDMMTAERMRARGEESAE